MAAQSPRSQTGCLGSMVGALVLVAIVVAVVFVGVIALGVVAALLVIGVLVLAVDRVLLSLSPKRRERRANQTRAFVWRFGSFPTDVVDAKVIDTTATSDEPPKPPGQGPDQLDGH